MILDATNKSIVASLAAAPATGGVFFAASGADITTTAFTPFSQDTFINSTTLTIVSAPSSGVQRVIKEIVAFNSDTAIATVRIFYRVGAVDRQIIDIALSPRDTLIYRENAGFMVIDSSGNIKNSPVSAVTASLQINIKDAANLTAVTAFASGTCHAYYIGVAPRASSTINLLTNVTTAAATITWAEIAIYRGTPVLMGNVTDFVRLGWADVAAIYNSLGRKNTAITLTTPCRVGDDIWVVLGSSATTPFQIRGALADDLQSGIYQTVSARPSTAPTASGTIFGATVVPGWVAIRYM